MKTRIPLSCLLLTLILAAGGCSGQKKGGADSSVTILTNSVDVPTSPSEPKAEVKISGVSRDEEMSLIDLLHVSGLLTRGTQQVAIINNNVVTMGEDMFLDTNMHRYKLQVLSIKGNAIKLKAEVTTPEDGK